MHSKSAEVPVYIPPHRFYLKVTQRSPAGKINACIYEERKERRLDLATFELVWNGLRRAGMGMLYANLRTRNELY